MRAWCLVGLVCLASWACGRSDIEAGGGAADAAAGPVSILPQIPSTPGLFLCGANICATATQACCFGVAGESLDGRCMTAALTCSGASFRCDEPADCAAISASGAKGGAGATDTCCLGLQPSSGSSGSSGISGALGISVGSRCTTRTSCSGLGQVILCRANSDCGANAVCCDSLGLGVCQATCPGV